MFQFIDIGANMTDPMFRGVYHDKKKHDDDYDAVLQRAIDQGMEKIMVTGGSLQDSKEALELVKQHDRLFCTVGVHPTRCNDFEKSGNPEQHLADLIMLAKDNADKVVSTGEFGLDYDRLHFCPKETQLKYFEYQFQMVEELKLPLFLHARAATDDFLDIIKRHRDKFTHGVVHSFTGTIEEAKAFLDLDLFIGINGCSLKTQENVDAMKSIPTEKLMIETDAPWCEIKATHAGFKSIQTVFPSKKKERWEPGVCIKGRCEPAQIVQVLEVMAAAREEEKEQLAKTMYENTERVFFGK